MSISTIPSVEQIGEPIVCDPSDLMNNGKAKQLPEPAVARRCTPNCDLAVGADVESTVGVNGMKPATHILHTRAEAGKRIGLEIDVTKIEQARSGRADKPAVLLRDTSVTDWALGIVPDRELRTHSQPHG